VRRIHSSPRQPGLIAEQCSGNDNALLSYLGFLTDRALFAHATSHTQVQQAR
jgi:hypothetical protein